MVRFRQSGARLGVGVYVELPALRAGSQKRLELLSLVLRSGLRGGGYASLSGPALYGKVPEQTLWRSVDPVHAILPLVSQQGQKALEIGRFTRFLPCLRLGSHAVLLELLRMVPGAIVT